RETDNSGPVLVRQLDPLSLSVTEYLLGEDGTRTAPVRRTWNTSGQVKSEARFVVKEPRNTSENELYSEWSKTYDGFNRLKTFLSPLKYQTAINRYDEVDRVQSYSLSDETEMLAEYPQTSPVIRQPCSLTAKTGETLNSLGSRTFDDLGRLRASEVGGNRRVYLFEQFASIPSSCITGNGNRLDFGYLPELDMSTGVTAYVGDSEEPEETVTFSYTQQPDTPTGLLQSAVCDNGGYQYQYDATGMVVRTVQTSGEQVYSVDVLRNTLQGIPLEESSPDGTQSRSFDKYGRLSHSTSGAFTTRTEYDALNRVCAVFVEENGVMVQGTRLTYDVFSRETTRKTEFLQHGNWLEHHYEYDEENRLVRRTTRTDDEQIAETYDYDNRGRLHCYAVEAGYAEGLLPRDEDGRRITGLQFSYDGLDNLNTLVTMFPNGEQDTGTYSYQGQQLATINHTLTEGENGYPETVSFDYDAEGNMTSVSKPGNEKTLTYSVRGQINSVNGVVYRYDAFGRQLRVGERNFRYLGQRVHSIEENGTAARFVRHGGVITASVGAETELYATDRQGSVVATSRNTKTDLHMYTPGGGNYGNDSLFGYNGELKDTVSGGYMLGQGVRLYQPSLGCFTSQDPLSALSGGDMNPYRYCHGDPMNYADPSGMMGVGAVLGNVLGIITG
ncbi:RHS repeat-associated core domain-containing protein, partial [Vibrio parahaemolyticus]|nr:RHS repeat-associated core domain-containing protein [Vibrio parahaemolyticus]